MFQMGLKNLIKITKKSNDIFIQTKWTVFPFSLTQAEFIDNQALFHHLLPILHEGGSSVVVYFWRRGCHDGGTGYPAAGGSSVVASKFIVAGGFSS